jgi:hypothetical protein
LWAMVATLLELWCLAGSFSSFQWTGADETITLQWWLQFQCCRLGRKS